MSGKGAKGLIMGKGAAANKEKDSKKKPISRSSRAGLQVLSPLHSSDLSLSLCFSLSILHSLFPPNKSNQLLNVGLSLVFRTLCFALCTVWFGLVPEKYYVYRDFLMSDFL